MIITSLSMGITDHSQLMSHEEVHALAAFGDKAATNALIKGERIIEQRSATYYINVDVEHDNNYWSKRYSGSRETMPYRCNFESDRLFIDALENWK